MKIAVSIGLTLPDEGGARYLEGIRRNILVLDRIYPGASLILHHDDTVPDDVVEAASISVEWPRNNGCDCMFWRFCSIGHPDFDAVLIRDADSVVNHREAAAVREWLESDLPIHTMHDHPHHGSARVMGGMWGARPGAFPYDFSHLVKWWIRNKGPFPHGADLEFLSRYVYPYAERWGMNHWGSASPHLNVRPFPGGPSPETGFIGEIIS